MNAPAPELNILLVEDNPDDELLVCRELRKGGLVFRSERVDSRTQFRAALDRGGWDVVIADYFLPGFSGLEALTILKEHRAPVPFVLVSGTVGEDIAIGSIQAGADDYLLKQNLMRLVPAVTKAIRAAAERRERAATEQALRESRERLELIYNSVSDFLVFLTAGGGGRWVLTSANRALLQKLDQIGSAVPLGGLLGREIGDVERNVFGLDAGTADWFAELRRRAVAAGRRVTAEREFRLPAGAFVAEFSVVPDLGPGGACEHLLIHGRDVTAQRRAEEQDRRVREQMIQAHRLEALGTLAGGIAHDFNNLLTGIFGFASLAQMAPTLTEAQAHCERIGQVAHRARELVGRILTFSRQQPANVGPVQVADVVRELVPLMRVSFPSSVELNVRLPDQCHPVLADSGQLHQVVLNLCTNAAHAMPAGGRLTVAVESAELPAPVPADLVPLAPGPHVKLTVSDTGVGMAPDTLRRVFEPFFTTKPVGQGTGLGLSVVHGIVQDHGGAIRVTSAVGQGTTFEIYFPQALAAVSPEPAPQPVPTGRGERVLCLDDDPALADLSAQLLGGLGYRAVMFTDPVVAFAEFVAAPEEFAAVLTDNRMPIWSGVEFAQKVVQVRADLPIVLATANIEPAALAAFQALSRGQLLIKPYTSEQLAQVMNRALS